MRLLAAVVLLAGCAQAPVAPEAREFLVRARALEGRGMDQRARRLLYVGDGAERSFLLERLSLFPEPASEPAARPAHSGVRVLVPGPAFGEGPTIEDVDQGDLGDCWVTAPLAAFAHLSPGRLVDLIDVAPDGAFIVRLFEKYLDHDLSVRFRLRVLVVRPEFLAHDASGRSFLYADPTPNGRPRIWVAVIEKAFAILHGGDYEGLNGGTPDAAFEAISGVEVRHAPPTDLLFEDLRSALRSRRAVVVSTRASAAKGIVPSHAYVVLEAGDGSGGRGRWVKLYNPQGTDDGALEPVVIAPFEALRSSASGVWVGQP